MRNEKIIEIADMLEGEINRMCVTNDIVELETMTYHAWKNIVRLQGIRHNEIVSRMRGEENDNS